MKEQAIQIQHRLNKATYTVTCSAKLLDHLLVYLDTAEDQDTVWVFVSALYHAGSELQTISVELDDLIKALDTDENTA